MLVAVVGVGSLSGTNTVPRSSYFPFTIANEIQKDLRMGRANPSVAGQRSSARSGTTGREGLRQAW